MLHELLILIQLEEDTRIVLFSTKYYQRISILNGEPVACIITELRSSGIRS